MVEAQVQKTIVLFGDSCSDSGNMPPLGVRSSTGTPFFAAPAAPYSNGATWILKLGNLWDTAVEASSRGGLNYAFVDAQTSIDTTTYAKLASVVPSLAITPSPPLPAPAATLPFATCVTFVPSMRTQINEFVTQRKDVSKEAVILQYGGVNNYLQNVGQVPTKQIGLSGAADLVANARTLQNAGFCNQVVFTAQNKTLVPGIPSADFALFGNTLNSALFWSSKIGHIT